MGVNQVFLVLSQALVGESAPFSISVPSPTKYRVQYSFQQPLSSWPPLAEEPPNGAQSRTYSQYGPGGRLGRQLNRLPGVKQPIRHGRRRLLRVRGERSLLLHRTHLKHQAAILVSGVTVPDHRHRTLWPEHTDNPV